MPDVTITAHTAPDGQSGEYQAHIPGTAAIARLTWVLRGEAREANHTLVPPEIGSRGVAAKLVEALIADARSQGFRIHPTCSYVAAQFKRHPEWADLL